jgi:hypothetical protein
LTNADNKIDLLPEKFTSQEEAAQFWDTHSVTDYEEFLEPADLKANVQTRHFEIEVDEESFLALQGTAKKQQKPVKQLASEIPKQKLTGSWPPTAVWPGTRPSPVARAL